jgi:hypothetical protein
MQQNGALGRRFAVEWFSHITPIQPKLCKGRIKFGHGLNLDTHLMGNDE